MKISKQEITKIYQQPFLDLLYEAHTIYQENFPKKDMQLSSLLSIKSGRCPEDCAYCPQSGRYKVDIQKHKLLTVEAVKTAAKKAKEMGATRFCLGAAWREPTDEDLSQVLAMIRCIKNLGLETCVTLGKLTDQQTQQLKAAELDYYNHNLDTSPEYYSKIITTHTYQDRLDTLAKIQNAGIKTCCGGIIGLGESQIDRIGFLYGLLSLETSPQSIPINVLEKFAGTPLENTIKIDNFELVRTIATARILFPKARVRLTAGRKSMSEELQALCFFAGANSIFLGEKLLMSDNPEYGTDIALLSKLGIKLQQSVD